MTQVDRWKHRPVVDRYLAFKDECALSRVEVPESGAHVVFVLPMPKSWSKRERERMFGTPHLQTPDVDNLLKGLLDAIYENDSMVWDIRVTKKWGNIGEIIIT